MYAYAYITQGHFIMPVNVKYSCCTYNVASGILHQHQNMHHQVCMSSL